MKSLLEPKWSDFEQKKKSQMFYLLNSYNNNNSGKLLSISPQQCFHGEAEPLEETGV